MSSTLTNSLSDINLLDKSKSNYENNIIIHGQDQKLSDFKIDELQNNYKQDNYNIESDILKNSNKIIENDFFDDNSNNCLLINDFENSNNTKIEIKNINTPTSANIDKENNSFNLSNAEIIYPKEVSNLNNISIEKELTVDYINDHSYKQSFNKDINVLNNYNEKGIENIKNNAKLDIGDLKNKYTVDTFDIKSRFSKFLDDSNKIGNCNKNQDSKYLLTDTENICKELYLSIKTIENNRDQIAKNIISKSMDLIILKEKIPQINKEKFQLELELVEEISKIEKKVELLERTNTKIENVRLF